MTGWTAESEDKFEGEVGRLLFLPDILEEIAREVGVGSSYSRRNMLPEELIAAILHQLPEPGAGSNDGSSGQGIGNQTSQHHEQVPLRREDGGTKRSFDASEPLQDAEPMDVWLVNSYNVLEPWGFYIHAGMDGASHFILWLEISPCKRATTVCKYYQRAVTRFGHPKRIQSNLGPENALMKEDIERAQGPDAFLIGTTQRMGQSWRLLKQQVISYYLSALEDLTEEFQISLEMGLNCFKAGLEGLNLNDPLQRVSLHKVFLPRLRKAFDDWVGCSNIRRVRGCTSRQGYRPSHVPQLLFQLREREARGVVPEVDRHAVDEAVLQADDLQHPGLRSARDYIHNAVKEKYKAIEQPRGVFKKSLELYREFKFHFNLTKACRLALDKGLV